MQPLHHCTIAHCTIACISLVCTQLVDVKPVLNLSGVTGTTLAGYWVSVTTSHDVRYLVAAGHVWFAEILNMYRICFELQGPMPPFLC